MSARSSSWDVAHVELGEVRHERAAFGTSRRIVGEDVVMERRCGSRRASPVAVAFGRNVSASSPGENPSRHASASGVEASPMLGDGQRGRAEVDVTASSHARSRWEREPAVLGRDGIAPIRHGHGLWRRRAGCRNRDDEDTRRDQSRLASATGAGHESVRTRSRSRVAMSQQLTPCWSPSDSCSDNPGRSCSS